MDAAANIWTYEKFAIFVSQSLSLYLLILVLHQTIVSNQMWIVRTLQLDDDALFEVIDAVTTIRNGSDLKQNKTTVELLFEKVIPIASVPGRYNSLLCHGLSGMFVFPEKYFS